MKLRLLTAVMLVGTAAAQDDGKPTQASAAPVATARAEAPSQSWYSQYDGNHFGLQVDAGVPAGASAALVYRPWRFLRVNGGVAYDVVAFGVKGGVTFVPFRWAVVPTLGLEAGHFWQGDATRFGTPSDPAVAKLLQNVGYDYLSADLGLEFGSQDRFVFYIRAGLTQLYPSVGNFQAALQAANAGVRITASDPTLSARGPAARLGFILYLF